MCELIHCVQRYTAVRSPFRVDCEKIPLSHFFYTSAAIDAMDKYQVWLTLTMPNWSTSGARLESHLHICHRRL